MKSRLPLAVFVSLLMLTGCATGPPVRSDFDRTANFTQYKTFVAAAFAQYPIPVPGKTQ